MTAYGTETELPGDVQHARSRSPRKGPTLGGLAIVLGAVIASSSPAPANSVLGMGLATLLAAFLYLTPGLLWGRRSGWPVELRLVVGTTLSVSLSYSLLLTIGLLTPLHPWLVWLAAAVVNVLGFLVPARPDLIDSEGLRIGWPAWLLCGAAAVLTVFESLQPPTFHLADSLALWAPLGQSIAANGDVTPTLPSMLAGSPPSVALLAGAPSAANGALMVPLAQLIHPAAMVVAMLGAAMLGASLSRRTGATIAVLVFVATPLLSRAVEFHDDYVASCIATAAAVVALRARRRSGAFLLGLLIGGATAIKLLGVLTALLVPAFLTRARRPGRVLLAVFAGAVIGSPWYLGNLVRFGNPTHPFLPGLFGEGPGMQLLVQDQADFLGVRNAAVLANAGWLAMILVVVGLTAGLWELARHYRLLTVVTLAVALVVFFLIWVESGYGVRHLLLYFPTAAGLAGGGLASWRPRRLRHAPLVLAGGIVLALAATSLVSIKKDLDGSVVSLPNSDGVDAVLRGKAGRLDSWSAVQREPMSAFGGMTPLWQELRRANPETKVFAFDDRHYFVPQVYLAADSLDAFPVYRAGTAAKRYDELRKQHVGFVLAHDAVDKSHVLLYPKGPFPDLARYPRYYRLMVRTTVGSLWKVRPPSSRSQ